MRKKSIVFVQYTNPAAYPPLEHSSRILADRGWKVAFLGTGSEGQANAFDFPAHPNITVKRLPFRRPGLRQKMQFLLFAFWIARETRRRGATWIYASDALSCPAALLASRLTSAKIIYHEHDAPPPSGGKFHQLILGSRRRVARAMQLAVIPNQVRIEAYRRETATSRPVACVWNCPERREVFAGRGRAENGTVLFYHGSLNTQRLPYAVLEALRQLPDTVSLRFAGYATTGHPTFVADFMAEAARLGVGARVSYLGAPAERGTLLEMCRQATVGAAFMPTTSNDLNMQAMSGASNKPFDYLASGLALLVSDLPDWKRLFAEPGLARPCNPNDAASIAAALRWYAENPEETRAIGESGRQQVLAQWNYESQFAPVLAELEGAS